MRFGYPCGGGALMGILDASREYGRSHTIFNRSYAHHRGINRCIWNREDSAKEDTMIDGQALFEKLEEIELAIRNHLMSEIKTNRTLIEGLRDELSVIRQSLNAQKSGFSVLNDKVHYLIELLE